MFRKNVGNHIEGSVRQNELETGRAVLYPHRMTKHSLFSYLAAPLKTYVEAFRDNPCDNLLNITGA